MCGSIRAVTTLPPTVVAYQMAPAVLLPTRLPVFGTEGTFLPITDRLDAIGGYAERHQKIFCGVGTTVAQPHVIGGTSALVAVPFDGYVHTGIGLEEVCALGQVISRVGADIGLVEVKERILHLAVELIPHTRLRWPGRRRRRTGGRWRRSDGDTSRRLC